MIACSCRYISGDTVNEFLQEKQTEQKGVLLSDVLSACSKPTRSCCGQFQACNQLLQEKIDTHNKSLSPEAQEELQRRIEAKEERRALSRQAHHKSPVSLNTPPNL
ncbi:MAG TPA: hypothetical protein VIF12_04005 [Micavibrio sp.]